MVADVCPVTRLRCEGPDLCSFLCCANNKTLRPIYERDLTQAEQYALVMSKKGE